MSDYAELLRAIEISAKHAPYCAQVLREAAAAIEELSRARSEAREMLYSRTLDEWVDVIREARQGGLSDDELHTLLDQMKFNVRNPAPNASPPSEPSPHATFSIQPASPRLYSLEELREPTPAMLEAGNACEGPALMKWQAMLDQRIREDG